MVVVCDMETSEDSVFKISKNEDARKVEPLECCAIASLVLADDQTWLRTTASVSGRLTFQLS